MQNKRKRENSGECYLADSEKRYERRSDTKIVTGLSIITIPTHIQNNFPDDITICLIQRWENILLLTKI